MPIELWWWVKPLFVTGLITMMVGFAVIMLVNTITEGDRVCGIIFCISLSPLLVSVLCGVGWFFANLLILVWRH